MNVLQICANPKPTEESVSKQLLTTFFSTLVDKNPDIEMEMIDLYQERPPFLSYAGYRAVWNPIYDPEYEMTSEEEAALHYAKKHAEQINSADVLVISTPMWNFGPPAVLKAWIDQVIAPNITYRLIGPRVEPLHRLKKVVLLVSSGHSYKEDDPRDALTGNIRSVFEMIGVQNIDIAWADKQSYQILAEDCEEHKQWAMDMAVEIAEEVAELEV